MQDTHLDDSVGDGRGFRPRFPATFPCGHGTILGRVAYDARDTALRVCAKTQLVEDTSVATNRKRRNLWLWGGLGSFVALVVLGIAIVARGKAATIEPSQLAKAEDGDIARSVVATGKVEPITKVEVKSKASGIVTRLDTDINAHVHKGQVLAQLDQQEILDQVAAQKATLAASESNARAAAAAIEYDKVNAAAPDLPMYKHTLRTGAGDVEGRRGLAAGAGRCRAEVSGGGERARQGDLADRGGYLEAASGARRRWSRRRRA